MRSTVANVKTKTPRTVTGWGECPKCGRTRRTTTGDLMVPHRYYSFQRGVMLDCPGAGQVARPIVLTGDD